MSRARLSVVLLVLCPVLAAGPLAQEARETAPVEVDGEVLFHVRGIEALPADRRAAEIASRITALARDPAFSVDTLRTEERAIATHITDGRQTVMGLVDEDGRLEGVQRAILAEAYVDRIRRAIVEYREARTRARLGAAAARSAGAVALAFGMFVLLLLSVRRAEGALQQAFDQRVGALGTGSVRRQHIKRLWQTLHGTIGVVRVAGTLALALVLIQYVLVQFPWTRGAGGRLFDAVATPLTGLAQSFVSAIPSLIVLTVLFFVTRFGLSLARIYLDAVHDRSIRWQVFEPEWARPTYTLVRAAMIGAAIVIAYPFIPGSETDAFKGLSILTGGLLAFGSGAMMANILSGYMLIYRRAFRVGDRVDIRDVHGIVTEMRLQATHIRTNKNEEITIPNATITAAEVRNYSRPARDGRLILHTEVGIGYETSWRQVEVLLIEAAHRTAHLEQEPPPFVVQLKLGEFAVTYQINAYTRHAEIMPIIYAQLHRNILDQFNEAGVQIMTPAYETDPDRPKIAKESWTAPAVEHTTE
jgi:small-conductance mechanosensitive channel